MLGIGPWELAIVVIIALVVIGPKRLPEIMRTVGKGIFELRKASNDFRRTLEHEVNLEDREEQGQRITEQREKYMEQLKKQQAAEVAAQTDTAAPADSSSGPAEPDDSNSTSS